MILEREGYQVNALASATELRAFPDRSRIDLFLLDVRLPDANGIDVLRELIANDITAPVIMISGHATIAHAVEATRAGAFDFLEKPLGRDRVLLAVRNALEQGTLRSENKRLRESVGPGTKMIGTSPAFERVVEQAGMAARSDARVLLIGESGTGKELLAAFIHEQSPFAEGPFVKVNCAAIPGELIESELFGHEKGSFTGATSMRRGKFELADNGTLFLDEIGDLHANSQAKLLRVLQEGEFHRVGGEQTIRVNVRVLSATNRDLQAMVTQGKFRGGSLLSRERGSSAGSCAARASAGHQTDGGILPRRFLEAQRIPPARIRYRSLGSVRALQMAWKRTRTAQRGGAYGDSLRPAT